MPEHVWSVLCRRAIIDQQSNQLSLLDVVEGFTFAPEQRLLDDIEHGKKVGINVPGVQLVSFWSRTNPDRPESFEFRTVLRTPTGKEEPPGGDPKNVSLQEFPRMRLLVNVEKLLFIGPGTYAFLVQWRGLKASRWQTVTAVPFDISYALPDMGALLGTKQRSATAKE